MTDAQKDYNWMMNIIDSANNTFHFDCIDKMIELFNAKHKDAVFTILLQEQRAVHFNNVHSILICHQ